MERNETTLTWLRNGASRAFVERFFNNFPLYFMLGVLAGMMATNNPELSIFECLGIACVGSLGLLLVVIPFAYHFLGIRYRIRRSPMYHRLFISDTLSKYNEYRKALPDLKKTDPQSVWL